MARKAVQGYTDKSLYDNTRYLGILATSDPNNEGYFKHLVNFDMSDTSQSLTPRQGQITTGLRVLNTDTDITLSANTVVFQDHQSGGHILWDLSAGERSTGYRVMLGDVLNPETKRIDIHESSVITNIDWSSVREYMLREHPGVKTYYDAIANDADATLESILVSTISEITKDQLPTPITNSSLVRSYVLKLRFDLPKTVFTELEAIVTYAYMFVGVYYREQETSIGSIIYPGNTIVVDVIDLEQVPTNIMEDRNLASHKSIIPHYNGMVYKVEHGGVDKLIPAVKQTMWGTDLDGPKKNTEVPFVSPIVYASTVGDSIEYRMNYIDRTVNHLIQPYFHLKEASELLGNSTAKWAYSFRVISSFGYGSVDLAEDGRIYNSPWYTLDNHTLTPTEVFDGFYKTVTNVYSDRLSARHFKGTTVLIDVVPAAPNMPTAEYMQGFPSGPTPPNFGYPGIPQHIERYNDIISMASNWESIINGYDTTSYNSFADAINTLGIAGARFKVYNTQEIRNAANAPLGPARVERTDPQAYESVDNFTKISADGGDRTNPTASYGEVLVTAAELLDIITPKKYYGNHLTFRMLPFAFPSVVLSYQGWNPPTESYKCWIITSGTYDGIENHYGPYTLPIYIHRYNLLDGEGSFKGVKELHDADGTPLSYGNLAITTDELRNELGLPEAYFQSGYFVEWYFKPYIPSDLANLSFQERNVLNTGWYTTNLRISVSLQYADTEVDLTSIVEYTLQDADNIIFSNNYVVFESRLVIWSKNNVYISEDGEYTWFKQGMRNTFNEHVVKVVPYKTILLVFTTQHLYAIYRVEVDVQIGTDEKGAAVMSKRIDWLKQTVLYNIITDIRYKDTIKVFNQMILFYSNDGQMFMIKPSTMIDSETQFTLQYFNKSANDILLNYDKYINERLLMYNRPAITRDQVRIQTQVSVSMINIYYTVPGVITYVLNYDVINNRYSVYDTLSTHHIYGFVHTDIGEVALTYHHSVTGVPETMWITRRYTEPNQMDANVDMHILSNFEKEPIYTLLDTGDLNLNNHLRKRYRDLYVTFKNLSTSKLLYTAETELDGVVSRPFYDQEIQLRDMAGMVYTVSVPKYDIRDLIADNTKPLGNVTVDDNPLLSNDVFEEDNILFDFEKYVSSMLITHKSSILGMGKVIRLKLQFISKGKYKLQSFGIVYKERRI